MERQQPGQTSRPNLDQGQPHPALSPLTFGFCSLWLLPRGLPQGCEGGSLPPRLACQRAGLQPRSLHGLGGPRLDPWLATRHPLCSLVGESSGQSRATVSAFSRSLSCLPGASMCLVCSPLKAPVCLHALHSPLTFPTCTRSLQVGAA